MIQRHTSSSAASSSANHGSVSQSSGHNFNHNNNRYATSHGDIHNSKALRKPNNSRRRWPLERIVGGLLLVVVLATYAFGTQFLLVSTTSSPPSRGGRYDGDRNATSGASGMLHDLAAGYAPSLRTAAWKPLPTHLQPRILGHYFATATSDSLVGTESLDDLNTYDSFTAGISKPDFLTKAEMKRQKQLTKSKDYEDGAADVWEDQGDDCGPQYEWQDGWLPACNLVFEVDATNTNRLPLFHTDHYNNKHGESVASDSRHSYTSFLANGYWRDVWKVENVRMPLTTSGQDERHPNFDEAVILKTMRYQHDFEARNYDRHRRDAMAMERLTSSKFTMNIYAACGNSGLFEYADGGSLEDSIQANNKILRKHRKDPAKNPDALAWKPSEKLIIAYQAASGLADVHNFAREGRPAVAHTDIQGGQFVYVDAVSTYKLNDFNRARFIGEHQTTTKDWKKGDLCLYYIGNNPGSFRSPEEYKHEGQTEKVDVYSLGNVFYWILTGLYPFGDTDMDDDEVIKHVKKGGRPDIPPAFANSTDPHTQVLVEAIEKCWIQDPSKRASSREIQRLVLSALQRLGVEDPSNQLVN